MLIRDFLPSRSVSNYIQCYRIVHYSFDIQETVPFKALPPRPEQCLHFFLRDHVVIGDSINKISYPPSIFLVGQRTSLVKLFNGSNLLNLQIVFQPTAVYRLTGVPAYELTNHYIDATSIFQKNIQDTFEKLQLARDYTELLCILNSFVQEQIDRSQKDALPLDFMANKMVKSGGNVSIDLLAKESCLCIRQLRRKFYERTGVTPKTFLRIIHFNKAYHFKNCFPYHDWSRIAAICGYSDYQHLVKDYKEFTGLTPPELHLLECNSPENVLGLTKDLYYSRFKATY